MTALIQLRKVSRVYGKGDAMVHALRDVDLDVNRGEFVAIMGPSGSGKSTVMNIIGCLDTPSSGEYFFDGQPVHAMSRNQRALLRRSQLGFVFQGFNLLPRTSAQENVELPLLYRGESASARHDAAQDVELPEPFVHVARDDDRLLAVGLVRHRFHLEHHVNGFRRPAGVPAGSWPVTSRSRGRRR